MQQIIQFFIRNKNFLLFIFLFLLSLLFTIQSHSYHKAKFVNSANFISGGIYERVNKVDEYLNLKIRNEELISENLRLREKQLNTTLGVFSKIDSSFQGRNYLVLKAKVINNSYSLRNNFLTLKGGKKDSIKEDLGVITSQGIVGVIDHISQNYSTVISILNSKSNINAKLKKSGHFGSLVWAGGDPSTVSLIDIQQKAPVAKGDTIVTGGKSTIFPENIPIGIISSFELDSSENFYTIQVKLFNDMTNIGHVYIIENLDRDEIKTLEAASANEK